MLSIEDIVISILLIIMSAFFSSAESAFLAIQNTSKLRHLVQNKNREAIRVDMMLKEPGRLLSTILLGNNLVNIAFAALITAITLAFLGESLGVAVSTIIATGILLVLGEIIPKTIAVNYPSQVAFLLARPLKFFELILLPIVLILQWISKIATLGKKPSTESITEAELLTLIDIGEAEGEFPSKEAEMLESVFKFGDLYTREIMTPRTEIVFIEKGTSMDDFIQIYQQHTHTRFPIYETSTDNIIGILSAKDILKSMTSISTNSTQTITDVIRNPYFVPETKRIAELFEELRSSGNQMAIAIDEYGGICGLVTLKQLLEEVVGRVGEEGISPEEEYETLGKDIYQLDGGMNVSEIKEELEINLGNGDYETVAGFVLDSLGHIPKAGEYFETSELLVEVVEMNGLKIEAVKVSKKQSSR